MKLDGAIAESIAYLSSREARESLARDPYWPKWDSPWWHMTILWEMGLAAEIPQSIVDGMIGRMNGQFLRFFPFTQEELPPGKDWHYDIACHCALGTMYQIFSARGVDVDARLPWIRPWFLRYQLPDGGMNCEGDAYAGSKKSSIVSTLPPLESILRHTRRPFTAEETAFLDRGAEYLIAHKLTRSARTGEIIGERWRELRFPRFYEYDVLRGLSFLAEWAAKLNRKLPEDAIGETVSDMAKRFPGGELKVEREPWRANKTLAGEKILDPDGRHKRFPSSSFPLLEAVGRTGAESPWLSAEWAAARASLNKRG